MTLTKEDLQAIEQLINTNLKPIKESQKLILNSQIEIVEKMTFLEKWILRFIDHQGLTPQSKELKKSIRDLD